MDDKPIWGGYFSDLACTIFDGPYSKFNKKNKPIVTGRYLNNKKVGVWRGFSDDGQLIDSANYKNGFIDGIALTWYADGSIKDSLIFENDGIGIGKGFWPDGKLKDLGNFISGKKSGQWTYYHMNGLKCQEVNYLADSVLSFTCFDEKGNLQSKNCYYEKEANYKGGDKAWINYLGEKLRITKLPEAYHQGKIYGTVYIQFVVSPEGNITDTKVLISIDPELDEIALRIIRISPRWEPAVQYNRNVKAYRRQPITFLKVE